MKLSKLFASGIALSIVMIVVIQMASMATAGATAGPKGERKVVICHATNTHQNPYTVNDVDKSSIDEVNNKYLNGHGDHEGPVWHTGIADHSWGDIIPPFTNDAGNSYPGQNWTAAGQKIYNDGCAIKTSAGTTTVNPVTTPTAGGQGGEILAASTNVPSTATLADTGIPLVANFAAGIVLIAASVVVSRKNFRLPFVR